MDRLFSWNFVSFGSVVNSTSMVTWQAGERAFSDIGTLIRPQSRRFWYLCLFQQNEAWDKKAKKRILMRAVHVCAYSSKHQPLSVLLRYGNSYDVEWGSFFSDCLSLLLLQSQHNIQALRRTSWKTSAVLRQCRVHFKDAWEETVCSLWRHSILITFVSVHFLWSLARIHSQSWTCFLSPPCSLCCIQGASVDCVQRNETWVTLSLETNWISQWDQKSTEMGDAVLDCSNSWACVDCLHTVMYAGTFWHLIQAF